MDRLEKLLEICNTFKNGRYDIKEFQSRLGTALLPEPETELGKVFIPIVNNATEELEGARFFYGHDRAYEVANKLIDLLSKYI